MHPISKHQVQRIRNMHDPENDILPHSPAVTWAANALAIAVLELEQTIATMQERIDQLTDDKQGE